jgi:hypothetical protein
MRLHKAFARIILFSLFIANFTFTGAAQTLTTHEMRVDLAAEAEGVTEASERGHTQSEELPEWSGRPSTAGHLHSRFDIALAQSLNERADPVDPADKFFSPELIRRMKEYFILGSIAGLFIGVGNGIQKEVMGTVAPGAYVFLLFFIYIPPLLLPTLEWRMSTQIHILTIYAISHSQTVGRSFEPLDEDPSDHEEDPVSRSLSNMGDEELKMLSFISRRMLNSVE